MFFRLIKQMALLEEITEQMKKDTPMEWIRAMDNIRNRGREVVNANIIYIA